MKNRIERLNSLLKQVIADVILKEVRNPLIHPLLTVTKVEVSKDLQHARVFISIIGSDIERETSLKALQSAAGFIAVNAAKQVVMRYFPALTFKLDTSADKQQVIDQLLNKIHTEQQSRSSSAENE